MPSTPDAVLKTLDVFADFSQRYAVPINTTINILSANAVEMVSSFMFARTPADIEHAHALKRDLIQSLRRHDLPLMRLDIDSQADPDTFTEGRYRDLLVRLKGLFDPNNIIAPGRYIPRA